MITFNQFKIWASEAIGKDLGSVYGDIGYTLPIPPDDMDKLIRIVYACANNDYKELISATVKTQVTLSKSYNIPINTINNWCNDVRTPPTYTILLLGYALLSDTIDWENPDYCE